MISLPISLHRRKRTGKEIKMLVEGLEEQYVVIGLQLELKFSSWSVKEVVEVQHLSIQRTRNWSFSAYVVTKRGVLFAGVKMVALYTPEKGVSARHLFFRSAITEERSPKGIMPQELAQNIFEETSRRMKKLRIVPSPQSA